MSRKGALNRGQRSGAEAALGRLAGLLPVLKRDRRASISILTAVTCPTLLMTMGVGVEVTNWIVVRQELQRTADIAALAGAADYAVTNGAYSAAIAAAGLAELNGAIGTTHRGWDAGSRTLRDNAVIVQIGAGMRNSNHVGVTVTVTQTVPLAFTKMMSSASSTTISATGWAEVAAQNQPCILALSPKGNGVVAGQDGPHLTLTGCSVRSNASILASGASTMSAPALYANGSIVGSGIGGALYQNDGTISDPYAKYAPVQDALARLSAGTGTSFSNNPNVTNALSPGTYSQWSIQGSVNLAPGIYYINGSISLGSQASVSGSGVTIVSSGPLSMTGGAALSISAATTPNNSGAIPGVVFAGNATSAASFVGNSGPSMTGVVYMPNADITFSGTAQKGTDGCLEVIAKSVTLSGNVGMASNCSAYGALTFASDNAAPAFLVQ